MSFPTASDLSEIPGLVPWLTGNSWQEEYILATLKSGASIPVNPIRPIDDDNISTARDCELIAEATCHNNQKSHRTRLFLDFPYNRALRRPTVKFSSECSCSVAYLCKHSVAVFEALKSNAAKLLDRY